MFDEAKKHSFDIPGKPFSANSGIVSLNNAFLRSFHVLKGYTFQEIHKLAEFQILCKFVF